MRRAGRRTNLALFAALAVSVASGVAAFMVGTERGRWVLWLHGAAGLGVLLLAPWKAVIVRRGIARARSGTWVSVILAILVVVAVAAGLGHATGLVVTVGPLTAMQLHVGAALASVPLSVWHVVARPTRPRATDLSRRALLRAGIYVGASGAAVLGVEATVRGLGLPGSERRFTGSFERGSFEPDRMPVTQWLNDRVPAAPVEGWPVTIAVSAGRERSVSDEEVASYGRVLNATLDCTGGWYAEQRWEGAWLADLVRPPSAARSVVIGSTTGYRRRLPVEALGELLLATRVGDGALSPGHGFPFRLVVPGRRGYWWVKWVDRIELTGSPPWWQPPFPLA